MAFPDTPLPVTVEMFLGGSWVDVAAAGADDVYVRDPIRVTRGQSEWAPHPDAGRAGFTVDNRSGDYSPRNPAGAHYPHLRLNTPARIGLAQGDTYLRLDAAGERAVTADHASLDITGDTDIRVELEPAAWSSGAHQIVASKWLTTGNQRSWVLRLNSDGTVSLFWSPDGTLTNALGSTSTVPVPTFGRVAIRAVLDVNPGTITFYTADTLDGPWEQLGGVITAGATTSVHSGSAPVVVGAGPSGSVIFVESATFTGRVYRLEVRDGIGGTAVANPDFTGQATGTTSFSDAAGRTWTLDSSGSDITSDRFRFHGELTTLPTASDQSARDVWAPVEADGPLRRLRQGAGELMSTLRRGILRSAAGVVQYWPAEEPSTATRFESAVGGPSLNVAVATPNPAAFDGFASSAPIPTLNGEQWSGAVPSYKGPHNGAQLRFLLHAPAGEATPAETIVQLHTSRLLWGILYETGGALRVVALNSEGTTVLNTGAVAFAVDNKLLRVSLELTQNGSDIDYLIRTQEPGATGVQWSGTLTGRRVGYVTRVVVNPGGGVGDISVGHIVVQKAVTSFTELRSELAAYVGEAAGRRVERLCREESVAFRAGGDLDATAKMGAQRPATLPTLLEEAAATDGGLLHEVADVFGVGYRPLASLVNQTAKVTLNYAAGHLAAPPEQTYDDQNIANDVTVTDASGVSARATLDEGALSTLPPPDGVGRYETSVDVNTASVAQLEQRAAWELLLGTVDADRYPRVSVNLAAPAIAADADLTQAILDLDIGDTIILRNLPTAPGDVRLIVIGVEEELGQFEYPIVWNCVPADPYRVGVYDDPDSRYDTAGSELASGVTATATTMSVATTLGPLWTADDAETPFDIVVGGERVTVTDVAGTSSPQTFTVTRSVNGVAKPHAAGADVRLADPVYYSLS